jgi:protein-S-isoprenylcysteine O-methyltransferase Ste14
VSLTLRNLLFSVVVPGLGAVAAPWWILMRGDTRPEPQAWPGVAVIGVGFALYVTCVWLFGVVGRGTPGPWDAPRHLVAAGPYRWVRNPIYISALLVVSGEAWLFLSVALLAYSVAMALVCHLFVIGYEEPTLRSRFGNEYESYVRSVPRWIPRPLERG